MKLPMQRRKGFTVVELIIVIAVIAILAAITVVSYNGITTRAENAKTLDAVSKYVDAATIYMAKNKQFIQTSTGALCLGTPKNNKCGNITATSTSGCGGFNATLWRGTSGGTSFTDQFGLGRKIPEPSGQVLTCGGQQHSGAMYYSATGASATVVYYLKGSEPCNGIREFTSVTRHQEADTTVCSGVLSQ